MDNEKIIGVAQQNALLEPKQPKQPKCPRCSSLLEFLCNVCRTPGGHLVAVIWCGNCGHTLQTQFIGVDEPQGPRIVRPS